MCKNFTIVQSAQLKKNKKIAQQGTKAHLFVDGFQYNCSDHFLKCIFSATENSIIYKPKKPYRALENFFKIAIFV